MWGAASARWRSPTPHSHQSSCTALGSAAPGAPPKRAASASRIRSTATTVPLRTSTSSSLPAGTSSLREICGVCVGGEKGRWTAGDGGGARDFRGVRGKLVCR